MNDKTKTALATAFGLGLLPYAPGTFGTLPGVLVHVILGLLFAKVVLFVLLSVLFVLACTASIKLAPWAETYWNLQDPRAFVMDEVAGYLLVPTCIYALDIFKIIQPVPLGQLVLFGFIAFRIFDATKPPPAYQIDRRLHTSWGILLDDLVAGIYAVLAIVIFRALFSFIR